MQFMGPAQVGRVHVKGCTMYNASGVQSHFNHSLTKRVIKKYSITALPNQSGDIDAPSRLILQFKVQPKRVTAHASKSGVHDQARLDRFYTVYYGTGC
jgi:hypothetical protein